MTDNDKIIESILCDTMEWFANIKGNDYQMGIAAGINIALSIMDAYNAQPHKKEKTDE